MSVATQVQVLKLLSDLSASADKIVEENASVFNVRVSEWISHVENKADSIVGESTTGESSEIPSLMSYFRGSTSEKGPRVSTALTEIQRLHLHRKVRKSSIKKTPSLRKSNVEVYATENNTPKLKIPLMIIKKVGLNANSSASSVEKKEATSQPLATLTPVLNKKGETTFLMNRSSKKRKSSSELSEIENMKKSKMEREKSMQNAQLEKKKQMCVKAKNSHTSLLLSSIKSSGTTNAAVLKENRTLQSKQDKALDNRKNMMALRQHKLEENKMKEKKEKTLEERMKLEKQKLIKSGGGREKAATTPKATMWRIIAGKEKTPGKKSMKSDQEKSVKRLQLNLKKMHTHNPGVLKSSEKTSVKKNKKKQETEKILNSTYVAPIGGEKPSTSSSCKGKTLKEVNIDSNLGAMKHISETQTHTKSIKTVKPPLKKVEPSPYTSAEKKGSESYSMTPARASFVSYDISEIRSDSEEEEQETNSKPIPSWATGVRLRNALLQQHHHPVDTDELFGNIVDLPDLAVIMGVSKKQYRKRTSSAVWNSSFS